MNTYQLKDVVRSKFSGRIFTISNLLTLYRCNCTPGAYSLITSPLQRVNNQEFGYGMRPTIVINSEIGRNPWINYGFIDL